MTFIELDFVITFLPFLSKISFLSPTRSMENPFGFKISRGDTEQTALRADLIFGSKTLFEKLRAISFLAVPFG